MSAAAECENPHKRVHEASAPCCNTAAVDFEVGSTGAVDFEPPCAKRTRPSLSCSVNANLCIDPKQDACCSQAKPGGEDSADGRQAEEVEVMSGQPWPDADERAIREMMSSLEQAITSNEQYDIEESSSSSSPVTSDKESDCSLKFAGDGNVSIDEGLQQLLQQADDQDWLSNFCQDWGNCAGDNSGNLSMYPYDDELGVVYNPLLDPNTSECAFDFL